jgi:DNA polymerase-1
MRPLLVIDGDSFAHRAYHALPKSIRRADKRPAGALVGFSNMLIRLWEAEEPRTVLVAWDTLEVPTYRHQAFESYQSGREFDAELLEQLALLPDLVASYGFAVAKGGGYEADDFLAAATDAETERGGHVLVATSDRDAFQLAAENATILQPTRGVSEIARIGPAEVRERYGVEPEQVPDFIALRGDPSDKLPGARGVGPKTAAQILGEYASLEEALDAGRFAAEADALRLYRQIAQLDHSAPLPPLEDRQPDWAGAAEYAGRLGLGALAGRLEERDKASKS